MIRCCINSPGPIQTRRVFVVGKTAIPTFVFNAWLSRSWTIMEDLTASIDGSESEPESTLDTPQAPGSGLTAEANKSLQLYGDLIVLLSNQPSLPQGVDLTRILEEFGRLRIWTEQTGASARDRGSLEETLRDDPALRDSITQCLERLGLQLSTAISFISPQSSDRSSAQDTDPDSDSGSSFTSNSKSSQDGPGNGLASSQRSMPRSRISKLPLLVRHITAQIRLLYSFSNILRRPRLKNRYLRSTGGGTGPQIPPPGPYEISHIEQKLKAWAQLTTHSFNDDSSDFGVEEDNAEPSRDVPEKLQEPSPVQLDPKLQGLCYRLAAANARRREQLRHWVSHPYGHSKRSRATFDTKSETKSRAAPDRKTVARSVLSSNIGTVVSGSSAPFSAIYESRGDPKNQTTVAKTLYASSIVGDDGVDGLRVPKVPRESLEAPQFECPYCYEMLDSEIMQYRTAWKRHVFRDLRPYTCTFPDCAEPGKLYVTRHEWIYHEMQVHRRTWTCRSCSHKCPTSEQMASHIESAHADGSNVAQQPQYLKALLQVSEVAAEDSVVEQCLFCSKNMSLRRLMPHVAGHMETLALFALPHGDFDVSPSDSEVSSVDYSTEGSIAPWRRMRRKLQ
ncbi:uncharacterized protein PgNI_07773 [Pyricularia grisea]|uniref:C2H2-type domain-containing protein n=1 Tax=Pyricularia grisea TaxID=148305 RepID=A0A6P8B0E6_PYRGI|nr:uncharacterized protein PgNI_07773 [Pyricularia grisea]TLD08304.1 hypothetical protein PgNI_07773 [Pyricularia grisea]